MKANLALPNRAFEGSFNPVSGNPGFAAFVDRIAALARRGFKGLVEALRPVSYEEAYLSQAQNHADLERRLLELSAGHEAMRGYFH